MNGSNEQKNTYVRQQLVGTLLAMLKTRPPEGISVTELTRKAGVGRVSFYRNYRSVKDILIQEEHRLFEQWGNQQDGKSETERADFGRSLLNFYRAHSDFYLTVWRAGMQDIIMDTVVGSLQITEDDPNPVAYLKSSIGYMIYGWVHEWMKRGMPETGDELADLIEKSREGAPQA